MNKKGFTLVELLAVIAVLAILIIFALPNVIKMLDKAKKETFVNEVKTLYKAAERKYLSEQINGNDLSNTRVCSEGEDVLGINGNLEYCVEYDESGKVNNLEASNNKYNVTLNDLSSVSDIDTKIGNVDSLLEGSLAPSLYSVFKNQFETSGNNIVGRYGDDASDGEHNDTYGVNVSKAIYYFKADNDTQANSVLSKNNVIFAGHCWQMIRTTDTGGVKLLYNGEEVNNRCYNVNDPTTAKHVGYVNEATYTVNSEYKYADNYTYSSGTFTLVDNIITQTWSNSTKDNLFGKYTCKTNGTTCSELYLVAKYVSSTQAKLIKLNNQAKYLQFGKLQFNTDASSPAYLGYKYGKTYPEYKVAENDMSEFKFGTDVTYSGGVYTLVNSIPYSTYIGDTTFEGYKKTHHYICKNGNNTCNEVGFITYYESNTSSAYYQKYTHVMLNGGVNIDEAVNKMLDSETNMYDSTIKIGLEAWYKKNLLSYSNKIEQKAIYCNRRDINDSGSYGIKPNGKINTWPAIGFKDMSNNRDLGCSDVKDQFSTVNNSASLSYPIGLATVPEMTLLNNNKLRNVAAEAIEENYYFLGSASYFNNSYANMRYVYSAGSLSHSWVSVALGVRPVISIRSGVSYSSGNGTLTSPYVIN